MTTAPINAARLSHLIGLIYDAAIDTSCWPVATEAIRLELVCANSALTLQKMPEGEFLVNVATNIPQHYVERMVEYPAEVLELWGGADVLMGAPISEPMVLSRMNPAATDLEQSTNRYALEWVKPQGLCDVIAIGFARDAGALGSLAFGRHIDTGAIGAREEEIVRLLIPHLQRAATINRMLDMSASAKATFEATIDNLSVPVLLTDDRMRIVHANTAARRLLERSDLLREVGGILGTTSKSVTRALEVAVERASSDIGALGRKGLGIPVRRDGGESGAIHVLPLRPGTARAPRAVVAIFVAHVATPFIPPTEIVAEAAASLGVEQSTVKTHMLRLYDKTGVKRRSGLQQLATSLSIPIAD